MLEICWKNDYFIWKPNEYTDYDFIGDWFVVLKGKQWVGFYRAEDIKHVECRDDHPICDEDSDNSGNMINGA